jgi:hypothetical protein
MVNLLMVVRKLSTQHLEIARHLIAVSPVRFYFIVLLILSLAHDFSRLLVVCGCGDDLLIGNDTTPHRHSRSPQRTGNEATNSKILAEIDEHRYQGTGRCCHNLGFKRNGFFEDTDIVTIHPATKEDPTHPGMTGTGKLALYISSLMLANYSM